MCIKALAFLAISEVGDCLFGNIPLMAAVLFFGVLFITLLQCAESQQLNCQCSGKLSLIPIPTDSLCAMTCHFIFLHP